ncbi:helix-turn-helix domain-containing protein [Kribbella sp. NBC_01245]|uniref:helix-turn-helix transcriptional regulator n=1 Tax=Kribbella sp. NBC_01245 TaxID=2903578 RepID=UPI002E292957|nr:helix-turn-helix transcriptional regulator [Kribbella sp. NBC_01245]
MTIPSTDSLTESTFGGRLRRCRQAAGLSLRQLAGQVGYDHSYLSQVERGLRPGSAHLATLCDQRLATGGELTTAYQQAHPPSPAPATGGKVETEPTAAPSLESTRHGLTFSFTQVPGVQEWQAVAAAYGQDVFSTDPAVLLTELTADLELLRQTVATDSSSPAALADPATRLTVVMAWTLAGLGRVREARRWWRTARATADHSADHTGDPELRLLPRAWEILSGWSERRSAAELLRLSEEALAQARGPVQASGAGVLVGKAQALAQLGRGAEARQTLAQLAEVVQTPDEGSLFGWPEYRLRHAESLVFTTLGDYLAAFDAQDRAFALYPAELCGELAMVQLHRAAGLVGYGELTGLGFAMRVLLELPAHCHNERLYVVAGQVLASVQPGDLAKSVVRDYRELLVTRPHLGR